MKKETGKTKVSRVKTGIPGFDGLIEGGFPENSSILVCGGPGTGKTIFAMEYLVKGTELNEKGLYVTFEEEEEALRSQAKQFGWNLEELEKKGKLKILATSVKDIDQDTIKRIKEMVRKEGYKRLVIDSLSTLIINAPIYVSSTDVTVKDVMKNNIIFSPPIIGDNIVRRFVYNFIEQLRDLDCTSLLVSEASQSGEFISRDTLSEFACDGIVMINFESVGGEFSRSLIVRKMRQTKNDEDIHPLEISNKGIIVHEVAK